MPSQNQVVEKVSKADWVKWREDRVTQYLVAAISLKRRGMLEEWADGRCSTNDHEHVVQGQTQAYRDVLEYILRDFDVIPTEEEHDDN